MPFFVGRGTVVPERRVQALTIIEHLDVLEQRQPRDGARGRRRVEFGLERAEETLHHRVVVTVTPAAHAARDAVALEQSLERTAGVLRAAIAVMDY